MVVDGALMLAGAAYIVITGLLFVFGANLLVLSILVWRRGARPGRPDAQPDVDPPVPLDLPTVTVQLPIYNELYVAQRVIEAACALDYPRDRLQIQVLDDSTDETVELVATAVGVARRNGVDIVHLHRRNRSGYKAGALRAGLEVATGELVALFDADFVPPPDFLTRTVGHFADPDLAFVQARWGHLNRGFSTITRLQSLAIDGHFLVEQAARGLGGYWFNFNGTAGIWRAAAITDAGGWTADTLTEDLDLSYRATLRGWHGVYKADLVVPGEIPAHISGFRRQQHRWARGSLECARKLLPTIWRSGARTAIKFQATTHLLSYTIHLLLAALVAVYPAVVLAGSRFPGLTTLYGVGYAFGVTSFAPAIFLISSQRQLRADWWRELPRIAAVAVLGSGLMINTVRATIQIATRPDPAFERTAKFGLDAVDHDRGPRRRSSPALWSADRYHLDLDWIVAVEVLVGGYAIGAAALAATQGNWGVLVFATMFGLGLLSIAGLSMLQAVSQVRGRGRGAGAGVNVDPSNSDLSSAMPPP